MTTTFGYAASTGGALICFTRASGQGVPHLHVAPSFYPCATLLVHYSGAIALSRGLGQGASWYSFDWRGAGKSTAPPGNVGFDELVDDVEAVADAIGHPFDLSAVNDGCGLALALAARRPDMVRRMLLIAPQGVNALGPEAQERSRRLAEADRIGWLAQFLMWVHPGTDPAETLEIARRAAAAKSTEVVRRHRDAATNVDLLKIAQEVVAPTFVIATGHELQDALDLAAVMRCAQAACWTDIGDGTINGAAWRRMWDGLFPPNEPGPSAPASREDGLAVSLSPREFEILALICRGLANAEIAGALGIAESTAKRHVANIFDKLGVASRTQAIALSYERGLLPAPSRRD